MPQDDDLSLKLEGLAARLLLTRLTFSVFHYVLTLDIPIGRRARDNGEARTVPLIRVKPRDLVVAGIERLPRTVGVRDGLPLLERTVRRPMFATSSRLRVMRPASIGSNCRCSASTARSMNAASCRLSQVCTSWDCIFSTPYRRATSRASVAMRNG